LDAMWHGPAFFVADNGSLHKKDEMIEIARASGTACLFLPPYSPDYNPIEKMWAKFKLWLRMNGDRLYDADPLAVIAEGMGTITANDCRGWIEHDLDLYRA